MSAVLSRFNALWDFKDKMDEATLMPIQWYPLMSAVLSRFKLLRDLIRLDCPHQDKMDKATWLQQTLGIEPIRQLQGRCCLLC